MTKEFVIRVTDSMVIRAARNQERPLTFSVEEGNPMNPDIEAILWIQDIDRLINGMLDLKREVTLEYGT